MIIKRKLLLCAGILFLSTLSYKSNAQLYAGFGIGGNQNYLITNVSNLISTEYVPKAGLNIEVPVEYKVNDWFSLKATPGFIQKSYQMQRTDYYAGIYEETKNSYLQLPVSTQFSFGEKKLRGFLELGGYAAYWVSGHVKGATPNIFNAPGYGTSYSSSVYQNIFDAYNPYYYDEKYAFDSKKDRRMELGVLAGVGINYQLKPTCKLFAVYKYYDALTSKDKNYQSDQKTSYNETGAFTVGLLYKLKYQFKHHAKIIKKVRGTINIDNN